MKKRVKYFVTGVVQGIGFRPHIYKVAHELELAGFVQNTSSGVTIEVEGESVQVDKFSLRLRRNGLPLAYITEIYEEEMSLLGDSEFVIRESKADNDRFVLIAPDIAVCDECLHELFDPADRRYRYPFINCTNCGPRYTIIDNIPYDRPNTSMKQFRMCSDCLDEYHDPTNRRFHAQPNACHHCGPALSLYDANGTVVPTDHPIPETIRLVKSGHIVAIKGLGGFHLAADAGNEIAVRRLRERKHREEKPFAVMTRDISAIRWFACINKEEEHLLSSPQRPIILLTKNGTGHLAPSVAPDNPYIGVMLPYTPLHHLLLEHEELAWVMTSGNLSEEPIAFDNDEATKRLHGIADYFLVHNRNIHLRSDDSVMRVVMGKPQQIRRARGFVPMPVFLKNKVSPILACGAELKNTICLTRANQAFLSQHIGDLKNKESLDFFEQTVVHMQRILAVTPDCIVYDLHPNYLSTRFALEQQEIQQRIGVQHHHAHVASCMAEHQLDGPVIGLAFDGTGLGTDQCIWGGEILLVNGPHFSRLAHLEYVPMPGGDQAVREPWRMALSYLYRVYGDEFMDLPLDFFTTIPEDRRRICVSMIQKGVNSPLTSSMGRLFDGVSSLLNICQRATYEGQPAMMLEMKRANDAEKFSYAATWNMDNGIYIVPIAPIIKGVVNDLMAGEAVEKVSQRFHATVVELFSRMCVELCTKLGVCSVVLSGGVFQNVVLTEGIVRRLNKEKIPTYIHKQVPPNDGGVSLGQVWIAAQQMNGV